MTHSHRSTNRRQAARRERFVKRIVQFGMSEMSFPGIDRIDKLFETSKVDDISETTNGTSETAEELRAEYHVFYPNVHSNANSRGNIRDNELVFFGAHDVLTEYLGYMNLGGNHDWFTVHFVPANSESGFPLSIEWEGEFSGVMPRFTDRSIAIICATR